MVFPEGTYPPAPRGYYEAKLKYLYPQDDTETDLAQRIWRWQQVARGEYPEEPSDEVAKKYFGCTNKEFWDRRVSELRARVVRAFDENDSAFFGRLEKAFKRAKNPVMNLEGHGMACLAFQKLNHCAGDYYIWPTKKEVRRLVESWRGHPPLSDKQWGRIWRETGLKALPRD